MNVGVMDFKILSQTLPVGSKLAERTLVISNPSIQVRVSGLILPSKIDRCMAFGDIKETFIFLPFDIKADFKSDIIDVFPESGGPKTMTPIRLPN